MRPNLDHSVTPGRYRGYALLAGVLVGIASLGFGGDLPNTGSTRPSVIVVDIIPEVLSGETNTNCEPNLSVNPANPSQIVATAWLPEPMGGKTSVVFVSVNGGGTWSCRSTVPLVKMSCDITARFGDLSNTFYLAALNDPDNNYQPQLTIAAIHDLAKYPMEAAATRHGKGIDQPYVAAGTINQKDRVFIGDNDWNSPSTRTATIERSLDGACSSPIFAPTPIEFDSAARDSSEIRPAISADGTKVYAVYNRVRAYNNDSREGAVILVRDDDGGNSAHLFSALEDGNHQPGFPVVPNRIFGWDRLLGRDRLGGDLALAVDPRNANRIYLVWGELVDDQPALYVQRSDNGGTKWEKLHTVTNAKSPGLAINDQGTVAFLYQQVVTGSNGEETWKTQLELTTDDFKTSKPPLTLAQFPACELDSIGGQPRLGDYLHLIAVKNDFYGIFSSSNVPEETRFPCGVTFQRLKDSKTRMLLDQDGNEVCPSIDPFFFKVTPEVSQEK